MPNDVADLEPALAKLIATLPNKMGLEKKPSAIDSQPKVEDSLTPTDPDNTVESKALAIENGQSDKAINAKSKTEKAKK
jgi:5-(carboxyamino)imidazole ribonucleotide synthase